MNPIAYIQFGLIGTGIILVLLDWFMGLNLFSYGMFFMGLATGFGLGAMYLHYKIKQLMKTEALK